MVVSSKSIKNITNDKDLWAGIADSHKTIQYMLAELVDDSISSIISNDVYRKEVAITITECKKEESNFDYLVSVEDSGAGIKNLNACFSFASTQGRESTLNKFGVGLKTILATFDPENTYWRVFTRSIEDAREDRYKLIEAPFRTRGMIVKEIISEPWKGVLKGSGTYIEFPCTKFLIETAGKEYCVHDGVLDQYVECIKEELSVIYTPLIEKGIRIRVVTYHANGSRRRCYLKPVRPEWDLSAPHNKDTVLYDFGKGLCRVSYIIGKIKNHKETKRYFQRNFENSGVMVYENGRLIESNIFKTIWTKTHNKFNAFLAVIEIESMDDPDALPLVATTKDSLVYSDERVQNFYKWIKSICPSPSYYIEKTPKGKNENETKRLNEAEKCKLLVEWLKNHYKEKAVIKRELSLYDFLEKNHPRLDIYLYAESAITLIECKAEESTSQDLFQLIMYHMGALHDQLTPSKLWLVAERHPDSVKEIANSLNMCKDTRGEDFNIELKTWSEFGIE